MSQADIEAIRDFALSQHDEGASISDEARAAYLHAAMSA